MPLRIKLLWKKDKVRLTCYSFVFAVFILILRRQDGVAGNISNLFYAAGTVYLLAGATRYIRNVGAFKTFPYMAYKHRFRRSVKKGIYEEERPMSLAEFTEKVIMDETRHKPVAWPLLAGVLCWGVSYGIYALV